MEAGPKKAVKELVKGLVISIVYSSDGEPMARGPQMAHRALSVGMRAKSPDRYPLAAEPRTGAYTEWPSSVAARPGTFSHLMPRSKLCSVPESVSERGGGATPAGEGADF